MKGIQMKQYLDDIVRHTISVVPVPVIRIDGDTTKTSVTAKADSIVIMATSTNPVPEFNGTYGISNLGNFKTLLNLPEYAEGAELDITYKTKEDGEKVPMAITLVNADGDFENMFRLLSPEHVPSAITFRGANWHLDFVPKSRSVNRLKSQAKLFGDKDATVTLKTDNGNLVCSAGSVSDASGSFVFEENVQGTLSHPSKYKLGDMLAILNLPGITGLKISDDGVMMFTVETGLFTFQYSLLALTQ